MSTAPDTVAALRAELARIDRATPAELPALYLDAIGLECVDADDEGPDDTPPDQVRAILRDMVHDHAARLGIAPAELEH